MSLSECRQTILIFQWHFLDNFQMFLVSPLQPYLFTRRDSLWPALRPQGSNILLLVSFFSMLTVTISLGSNVAKTQNCLLCWFSMLLVHTGILSKVMAASLMAYGPSSGLACQTSETPMSSWSMPGISQTLSTPPLSLPPSSPSQLLQNTELSAHWAKTFWFRQLFESF